MGNDGNIGALTLLPPLVAIVLAFLTKEVLTSLLAGALIGTALLVSTQETVTGMLSFLPSVLRQFCKTLIGILSDPGNTAIIILCLGIGGLTSLIHHAGGFSALSDLFARYIKNSRQAQGISCLLALTLFFDDYANALITGPVMRPVMDRTGVSREKLSFIVDSTAAPVAGIALISSWIAVELTAIRAGFEILSIEESAYSIFLGSIPFCFYNLFCVGFVLLTILFGRDYGPMHPAECRARSGIAASPDKSRDRKGGRKGPYSRAALAIAICSILFLIAYTILGIFSSGVYHARAMGLLPSEAGFSFEMLRVAFGHAETVTVLVEASLLTAMLAIVASIATKTLSFPDAIGAWTDGAVQLLPTILILALAWTLSEITAQLGTAEYLTELLTGSLPSRLLPSLVFLLCCAVSFSAGSYGCMLLIMPIAVPLAYTLAHTDPMVQDPRALLCACVASVLSGSIFGDHCSPVTDTTILSAQGSGCDLLSHVKTQMPYALTVAAAATLLGTLPAGFGVSPLVCLPLGLAVLTLILLRFGKHPVTHQPDYTKTNKT